MASAGPGTPAVALSTLRSARCCATTLSLRALLGGATLRVGIGLIGLALLTLLATTARHHLAVLATLTLLTVTALASTARHLLAHRRLIAATVVVVITKAEPTDGKTDDKANGCGTASNSGDLALTGLCLCRGHGSRNRSCSRRGCCGGLGGRRSGRSFWSWGFGCFAHGTQHQPQR